MSQECCGSEEKTCCKQAVEAYKNAQAAERRKRKDRESTIFCGLFAAAITFSLIFAPPKDTYIFWAYSIIATLGWWVVLSFGYKKWNSTKIS